MYREEDDWNDMVAGEIERECGSRPGPEFFEPCGDDYEYDPVVEEALRLGVPLSDYVNFLMDLAAAEPAPEPTDAEIEAMYAASTVPLPKAA